MATKRYLRCPACGSLRSRDIFGINARDEFTELPEYEGHLAIQEIGGRGRCSWTFHDVDVGLCIALREALLVAVKRITNEIRELPGYEDFGEDDEADADN